MRDDDPKDVGDEEVEGDALEADIMGADGAFAAESHGTTAQEAVEGEGLDRQLAQERPDRPAADEAVSVVDEGVSDEEDELVGEAVTTRDAAPAPEEAAVTVREEAPGQTDHEDHHSVDPERPERG